MEQDMTFSVAPLQTHKSRSQNGSFHTVFSACSSKDGMRSPHSRTEQITPPLTPSISTEDLAPPEVPRSQFHHYLRAVYAFHPPCDDSSLSVTLPLNQGDLILIHTIHENGWADGTLLASSKRGWLPTNYCEAYDPQAMSRLMVALTRFYDDVLDCDATASLDALCNQDYMRGLVAGVRYLFETTECLNRESPLLSLDTGIASLRRYRRTVLSELSHLSKLAKCVDSNISGRNMEPLESDILERMLSTVFRMVLRAAKFHEVWLDETSVLHQVDDFTSPFSMNLAMPTAPPPTPPADANSFSTSETYRAATPTEFVQSPTVAWSQAGSEQSHEAQDNCVPQAIRPSSAQLTWQPVSHRLSYTRRTSTLRSSKLASERLLNTHEAFLALLQVFLSCHLRSRSANEILVATRRTLHAGRAMMTVVDAVWDRGRSAVHLEEVRDNMYGTIAELVDAARGIFQPTDHSDRDDYDQEEMHRLEDAATSCVRVAGQCVASTRYALELIGDFEFETLDSPFDNVEYNSPKVNDEETKVTEEDTCDKSETPVAEPTIISKPPMSPTRLDRELPPPPPRIDTEFCSADRAMSIPQDDYTPSSSVISSGLLPPLSSVYTPASAMTEHSPMSLIATTCVEKSEQSEAPDLMASSSFASVETFCSSVRDSEKSMLSSSTGASSVDATTFQSEDDTAVWTSQESRSIEEVCDELEAAVLEQTHAHELIFNKDGLVVGGTLPALIERLTTHDTTPDAMFVSTFYLTFRLFTSSDNFARLLIERFESVNEKSPIAAPVKLRVYNVFKGWLESHWRMDCDEIALEVIREFARNQLTALLPSAGMRLEQLIDQVAKASAPLVPRLISSIGRTNTSTLHPAAPEKLAPTPVVTKSQHTMLRNWKNGGSTPSILDFEALEIARQITLKESAIMCSILPEELIGTEWMKKSGSLAVNVRASSTLSNDLTNYAIDTILQHEDHSKRAKIIKQWVKVGAKCLEMNNYGALTAINCALDSSTIQRLKRTWDAVSSKTKALLQQFRMLVSCDKNYGNLRARLAEIQTPCLPFVGMFLTDLAFTDLGNTPTRTLHGAGADGSKDVINFDKHFRTAKLISEFQRLQVPYTLQEVPEMQAWLQDELVRVRSQTESADSAQSKQYRRSLYLEPREQVALKVNTSSTNLPTIAEKPLSKTPKEKVEFLGMVFGKS